MRQQKGFTLIELMVVLAVMAVLSAGAIYSLQSLAPKAIEKDAQRLSVLLEKARAQSRSSGVAVTFTADGERFGFSTGAENPALGRWLSTETAALPATLVLGPDPVIEPQAVVLLGSDGERRTVQTDGVRPFKVESDK